MVVACVRIPACVKAGCSGLAWLPWSDLAALALWVLPLHQRASGGLKKTPASIPQGVLSLKGPHPSPYCNSGVLTHLDVA